MLAEAIWSTLNFEDGTIQSPDVSFRRVTEAYPHSATVAYWCGVFGALINEQSTVSSDIIETIQQMGTNSLVEDAQDPALRRRYAMMQQSSAIIADRLKARHALLPNSNAALGPEELFFKALDLDPNLSIAWVELIESSDTKIATAACDGWAAAEPENALPLYAKAILLADSNPEGMGQGVIESIEAGNRRKRCIAPNKPWPSKFTLSFLGSIRKDYPDLAGKPVSPSKFREIVTRVVDQFEFIGGANALSVSNFRRLTNGILLTSHRFDIRSDIRHLTAATEMGYHLLESNRFLFGISMGGTERAARRLLTIAMTQGDFVSANRLRQNWDRTRGVIEKLGERFDKNHDHQDSFDIDQDAKEVMSENRQLLTVPTIDLSIDRSTIRRQTIEASVFKSGDGRTMISHNDQPKFPSRLRRKDLVELGHIELDDFITNIRNQGRNEQTTITIRLIITDLYSLDGVYQTCFSRGYIGKRDPCVLVFEDDETRMKFYKRYPAMELRFEVIAQSP